MDKVDDKLEFVQTFEVRELRWITGGNQRIKTSPNQRAGAAAEHCLLTKKIGLRLLSKSRLHYAGTRASDSLCPRQRHLFAVPGGILMNYDQTRHAAPSHKLPAHHRPESFGSHHHNIHIFLRNNRPVINREAMCEEQSLFRAQAGSDLFRVNRGHLRVESATKIMSPRRTASGVLKTVRPLRCTRSRDLLPG